ncbi:MAG: glycosyltransferase [Opitutales bacterium]
MNPFSSKPWRQLPSNASDICPPLLGSGAWAGHLPFIYDLIYNLRPSTILELGVDRGESLLAMSDACKRWNPQCTITGIDSWEGDPHAGTSSIHLYESVLSDIFKYEFENTQVIRDRFENQVNSFQDQSIDILHIDGWHTYSAVSHDWDLFFNKVKPNGIILIHDTRVIGGEYEVHAFFDERKKEFPSIEFYHSFGLACLEKTPSKNFTSSFLKKTRKKPDLWRAHYESRYSEWASLHASHPERIKHTESVALPFKLEDSFKEKRDEFLSANKELKKAQPAGNNPTKTLKQEIAFSIFTPVYQPRADLLKAAARSVLEQTYTNWEWILVDDGSGDEYIPAIEEISKLDSRIRILKHDSNKHIAEALNTALYAAKNDWCCILDQDDLLAADALSVLSEYVEAHPNVGLLYSDEDKTDLSGNTSFQTYHKPGVQPELLLSQNYFNHLSCFNKSEAIQIGGFDNTFKGCQDWEFFLRLVKNFGFDRVVHVPYVLYHWRSHEGSTAADIGVKPYVSENTLHCIEKHHQGSPRIRLSKDGYAERQFEELPEGLISIFYTLDPSAKSIEETGNTHHLIGGPDYIRSRISEVSNNHSDSTILLCPSTIDLNEKTKKNLCGFLSQDHVAFVAPHIYEEDSKSYINAFSLNTRGLAENASDSINKDHEGYFMNLRLPTNPDILDISLAAFKGRSWKMYCDGTDNVSLQSISLNVQAGGKFFAWLPEKVTCSKFRGLFSMGDSGEKTIRFRTHFVSPHRKQFVAANEENNLQRWPGISGYHHK